MQAGHARRWKLFELDKAGAFVTRPDARAWQEDDAHALCKHLLGESKVLGVIFMDATGRIRGWGSGATFITGFTPDDAIGEPLSILFTPEDRERALDAQELRIAAEVGVAEDERWHVRKDGGRIWTTGATMPLRDDGGQVTGFVKVFRDATHLQGRIRFLENGLQECTARQARHAYFVSSIAHELRNPLAPLKNGLHLLHMHALQSEALQQPLEVMDRQMAFLERFVEDLVDMMRVQTGKLSLTYSTVSAQQLVAEALEVINEAAASRQVVVQPVLPAVPLHVEVDDKRMVQVLVNLLGNAIKFTQPGGSVWISITADRTHFFVFVKDNGKGIAPELLTQVFDAFTQAGGADTHRGEGIGIGLAVVKEIVALHKGTVEVQSKGEGKGSEFIVRMPLRKPREPEIESRARSP
jgi:two-component system CheB/CheR fusion protein